MELLQRPDEHEFVTRIEFERLSAELEALRAEVRVYRSTAGRGELGARR